MHFVVSILPSRSFHTAIVVTNCCEALNHWIHHQVADRKHQAIDNEVLKRRAVKQMGAQDLASRQTHEWVIISQLSIFSRLFQISQNLYHVYFLISSTLPSLAP